MARRPTRRLAGSLALGSLLATGALLALGGMLGACSSPPRPIRPADDLASPNPSVRAQAAGEVARLGALEHLPAVIELLDDDDATVRLMAGRTLRALTGHDTGYRPYAPPDELRAQVEAWRAWWAAQAPGPRGGRP
ncbi:MAG: HEAT repeat domain-containing protein [Planctomycetia bacterium]